MESLTFFFFNDTATTEIYTLSLHDLFRSRALRHLQGQGSLEGDRAVSRAARWRARARDGDDADAGGRGRSEEHTSELQSRLHLVCRLLLEKKKIKRA